MSPNEKSAWFNMVVCVVCLVIFLALFLFLRDTLGAFRALQVASSSFALVALSAFGPLLFRHGRNGDMVLTTEEGKTVHYPYRRYLAIGVLVGLVNGAVILVLALVRFGIAPVSFASALPVIAITSIVSLIVFLGILYWMKHRASVLETENMSSGDVFMFGPDLDERDLAIKRMARWSGFGAFWIVYIFGILGFWGWIRMQGETIVAINVNALPLLIFGAFLLILMVDSLVTIILYRRGE